MRLTDDLLADLIREWITQYGQLLRTEPELAARLMAGRDDLELVPVPRALLNNLREDKDERVGVPPRERPNLLAEGEAR